MRDNNANLMESASMRTRLVYGLTVMSVWLLGGLMVSAQETPDKASAALAEALMRAKVSLAEGLTVSEREGTPISGKFALEEGQLQLSIYTRKGDTFSKVIVDPTTGKVIKVEAITNGMALTAATAQQAAMATARRALTAVADTAGKLYTGFRVVSIVPAVKGGHAVVDMTLIKDGKFTTIAESLD
jgi:hypothetical protein